MTQPNGPRVHVTSPAFSPLPYGLLTSLSTETRFPQNQHWRTGVTYETLCAQADTTYDDCFAVSGTGGAVPPPAAAKSATAEILWRGATPFTVYAEVNCSAPGFWDNAQDLIAQTHARAEETAVETALWTGRAGDQRVVYPHLASDIEITDNRGILLQTAATVVTGGTLDIVEGIGRLEAELAECYHGVGVLHVPRVLAPAMANASLITREGFRYRTTNGNVVVFGTGYTGSSPSGASQAGAVTVYATGGMFIYRSELETTPSISTIDRDTNLVSVIAERTYVVGWECCHLAVEISIGGIVTGFAGSAGGL